MNAVANIAYTQAMHTISLQIMIKDRKKNVYGKNWHVVSRNKITVVGKFIVFWFKDYELCFIKVNVRRLYMLNGQPEATNDGERKMTWRFERIDFIYLFLFIFLWLLLWFGSAVQTWDYNQWRSH